MKRLARHGLGILMAILLAMLPVVFAPTEASAAGTTSLTIKKLASDGKIILAERTVDYKWLMDPANIDVMGDGETHYYHQGPVFIDDPDEETEQMLRWNPEEDTNVLEKDMGAVKGTNVKDLCELVGGMEEGDTLTIKARDGLKKTFAYKNVYQYSDREGPMVVCWYKDGQYPDTGYNEGMRLVWFADNSVNPWGVHAFGNWDWHEAADPQYWYYYIGSGGELYPTTTGLSVQYVSELIINSSLPAPLAPPVLSADTENNEVGQAVDITFTDDAAWRAAITGITVNGSALTGEQYTITEGNINITADVFTEAGDYEIVVSATGYSNATVIQPMVAEPVAPVAAFTAETTSGTAPLIVQFTDQSTGSPASWAWDFDNDGTTDSTEQNPTHEYSVAGVYSVKLTVTNAAGSDEELKTDYITVTAPVAKTWYVDDSGDADFTSIQASVTAASAGDTIIVKDGTYNENIIVDKSLVIRSENGSAQTIIQAANSNADVINITAANVTIDGFTLSGATAMDKAGIKISGSSSSSCTVRNNISTGNNLGISIQGNAANNTVSNNVVTQSGRYGINLSNTTGNSITGNTCSNNTAGSGFAIYLADNANNNTVSGNISESNTYGIRVKNAYSNNIFNNIFSDNNTGLEIATGSKENVFYLNNFIDNASQLSAGYGAVAGNFWNSQADQTYTYKGVQYTGPVGNYWSDYTGADADGNGIGDTPYQTIATDKDDYPLMGPWQEGVITEPVVKPKEPPVLTADTENNEVGQAVDLTFTDDEAWRSAITEITVDGAVLANDKYTVSAGTITINADVFTEAKDYTVVVKAAGYEDAAVVQTIKAASEPHPVYTVTPEADDAYTTGTTPEGISTMTVNSGVTGFKYFTVNIAPVISHSGNETVVFAHFRNGSQLAINATRADFDQVETAQAGFNVQSGDVIKAYIVDNLTNAIDVNPIIFQ